jgi:hypothetical protein
MDDVQNCDSYIYIYIIVGRAVAQAVSRWLPTVAARVRSWVRSCEEIGTGAGFLRELRFPLPVIPSIALHIITHHQRGWYNRPVVASVDSVPLHLKREKYTPSSHSFKHQNTFISGLFVYLCVVNVHCIKKYVRAKMMCAIDLRIVL